MDAEPVATAVFVSERIVRLAAISTANLLFKVFKSIEQIFRCLVAIFPIVCESFRDDIARSIGSRAAEGTRGPTTNLFDEIWEIEMNIH